MLSIDEAWKAARDEDGERSEAAELTLNYLRKTIGSKPCKHLSRRVCWTCAGDKDPSWDVDILRADRLDGYTFQCAPMDGRRAAKMFESWEKDEEDRRAGVETCSTEEAGRVVLVDNQQRHTLKDDDPNARETKRMVINAFGGTARQQSLLNVSVELSKGELCDQQGMRFSSTKIEEEHCVLWKRCAVHLLRPTSCGLIKCEWTFTELVTCTEGSIVIALWPAARANWTLHGVMMLHTDIHGPDHNSIAYEADLRSPYVIHLEPGQMVVIPPMTVWKRIAITKAVVLSYYAIPRFLCQQPVLRSIFDNVTFFGMLSPDKDGDKILEKEVAVDLDWWMAIRDGAYKDVSPWTSEIAKEVVRLLSPLSKSVTVN